MGMNWPEEGIRMTSERGGMEGGEGHAVPSVRWCVKCRSEEAYEGSDMCWSCIGKATDEIFHPQTGNVPVLVIAVLLFLSGVLVMAQGAIMVADMHGGYVLLGFDLGPASFWGALYLLLGIMILGSAYSTIRRRSMLAPLLGAIISTASMAFIVGGVIGLVTLALLFIFKEHFE